MADKKSYALPDSFQFRAFYAQKRRRSRNTNVVLPITRTFIDLDTIANAYYEIASPFTFTGDFEIEVDFATTDTGTDNILLGKAGDGRGFVRLQNGTPSINFSQAAVAFTFGSNTFYDGELHTLKIENTSGTIKLFIDGVLQGTTTPADISNTNFNAIGHKSGQFFNGIIANANFTDKSGASDVVTTFRLDELTANTENSQQANNSVTYQNIAQDVRDTYTLIEGDWVGSEEVANGNFATDSDWALFNGATISNNRANIIGDGSSFTSVSQASVFQGDKQYSINLDVVINSGLGIKIQSAGNEDIGFVTTTGNYTFTFNQLGGTSLIIGRRTGGTAFSASIDNVSVKRLIEVAS